MKFDNVNWENVFMMCNRKLVMSVFILLALFFFSSVVAGAEKIPFLQNETISEIRDKITANGYSFTVSENWVTRLSVEERRKLLSRHAPLVPRRLGRVDDGPLVVRSVTEIPASFDWRDVAGHSYIGPIRDQGSCGSCYAFGACAAAEGVYNYAMGKYDDECLDLSEAFLAFCLDQYYDGFDGCRGASYDYEELQALVDLGVCLEASYPYSAVDEGCVDGSEDALRAKYAGWYRIPCGDIMAIKSALMTYGVLDVAVQATSAFVAYESGVFVDSTTECGYDPCYYAVTNHAVALVGWEDTSLDGDGYWILRNSWGSDWGENGYMKIAYRSAHVACAACYMVYSPLLGSISGAKWNDYDGDGVWNTGEPGLAGWKIFIDINFNNQWGAGEIYALTDANGEYSFTGLDLIGNYVIAEEQQDGWSQTFPFPDPGATEAVHTVDLGVGDVVTDINFANQGPSASVTVKVVGTPSEYCDFIQDAYDFVGNGGGGDPGVIQMQIGNFVESPVFDEPVNISLHGGFDSDFSEQVGVTNLFGSLTVAAGSVTFERIVIQGAL